MKRQFFLCNLVGFFLVLLFLVHLLSWGLVGFWIILILVLFCDLVEKSDLAVVFSVKKLKKNGNGEEYL